MKTIRFTLAATAASLMLVAGMASACNEKAHATTASAGCAKKASDGTVPAGCAKKASATTACAKTASAKACCAKKGEGAQTASMEGCAKKASAKACCAKDATTTAQVGEMSDVKTCTFRPGAVAFKGTVICNHCDLKKAETCQTMFRTDSGCVFTLAGDNVSDLKEQAGGGKKLVRVKGSVSESGELSVSTYRVVKSLEGASAL